MAMSLAALEILEQAQLPPAHARAIARALEVDSSARLENLVTKLDLSDLKGELKVEMREMKSEVSRWILLAVMGQTAASAGIMHLLLR